MNALKYASAFPVIIISSMQKSSKAASMKGLQYNGYFSDNSLFRLWYSQPFSELTSILRQPEKGELHENI
jgi:hypothetical protein